MTCCVRNATFTADGIDLEREGLQAPSSTWTFMINDNPRGAILNVLTHGILRRLGLARHGGAIETTADLRRADSDKQQQTTDRFEQN